MRHLPAFPFAVFPFAAITLAACAVPPGPQAAPRQPPQLLRTVTLAPGAGAELAPGFTLRFDEVEDSRCPPGVNCVWAGKLACRFSLLRAGAAPESFTLAPGDGGHVSPALDGARIALDEASLPAPAAPGAAPNHRVTLTLTPAPTPAPAPP